MSHYFGQCPLWSGGENLKVKPNKVQIIFKKNSGAKFLPISLPETHKQDPGNVQLFLRQNFCNW